MKFLFKYLVVLNLLFLIVSSCQKMDDTYKKFVVPGGLTYPGKAVRPVAHSGRNRVIVSWLKGTDPSVIKANVYWNNYTDSVTVNISPDEDSINVIISNLPEQQYTFEIVTFDSKGNKSIPAEVLGSSYGDIYQASLLDRPIVKAINNGKDTSFIKWGAANISGGAYATEVAYTNNSGQNVLQRFAVSDTQSFFTPTNVVDIKYRTVYLPDSLAVDTFLTNFVPYKIPIKLEKSIWTITADSYEATGQLPNGAPEMVIDDDPNTYWHTDHTVAPTPGFPHWLMVDLKSPAPLALVELTSRSAYLNVDATDFIVQGSMDGSTWTDYGTFKQPDIAGPQGFYIDNSPTVRYVRIYMTKGPNYYTHLAELSIYKY